MGGLVIFLLPSTEDIWPQIISKVCNTCSTVDSCHFLLLVKSQRQSSLFLKSNDLKNWCKICPLASICNLCLDCINFLCVSRHLLTLIEPMCSQFFSELTSLPVFLKPCSSRLPFLPLVISWIVGRFKCCFLHFQSLTLDSSKLFKLIPYCGTVISFGFL